MAASVMHIFVAPTRGAPMESRQLVEALADGGLDGDRYADPANRRGPDYQVTLIESENIEAFSEMIDACMHPGSRPGATSCTAGCAVNDLRHAVQGRRRHLPGPRAL